MVDVSPLDKQIKQCETLITEYEKKHKALGDRAQRIVDAIECLTAEHGILHQEAATLLQSIEQTRERVVYLGAEKKELLEKELEKQQERATAKERKRQAEIAAREAEHKQKVQEEEAARVLAAQEEKRLATLSAKATQKRIADKKRRERLARKNKRQKRQNPRTSMEKIARQEVNQEKSVDTQQEKDVVEASDVVANSHVNGADGIQDEMDGTRVDDVQMTDAGNPRKDDLVEIKRKRVPQETTMQPQKEKNKTRDSVGKGEKGTSWISKSFTLLATRLNNLYVVKGEGDERDDTCTLLERAEFEIQALEELWPRVEDTNLMIQNTNKSARALGLDLTPLKPIEFIPPCHWVDRLNAKSALLRRLFAQPSMFKGMLELANNWSMAAYQDAPASWSRLVVPILRVIGVHTVKHEETRTSLIRSLLTVLCNNPLMWTLLVEEPAKFAADFLKNAAQYRSPVAVLDELLTHKVEELRMHSAAIKLKMA